MKLNNIFLLFLLLLTFGCSNNEPKSFLANVAKNIIKANDSSRDSIEKFANDKKIELGLNKNLIFNDIVTITNDTQDIEAIVLYLENLSKYSSADISSGKEKIKATSKLKIGKIQLLHKETLDENTDNYSKNTMLLIDNKEIYNSILTDLVSTKIKTNLTEKQLLELLKENGLNITIIAYAKDKEAKSILFNAKINKN
jgi:hypothetical protein